VPPRSAPTMGLSAQQAAPTPAVPPSMKPNHNPNAARHHGVTDSATLYLCRQGTTWAVVIESPRVRAAVRLRHTGRDPYDAQAELLSCAHRACPDAAIISTDGALECADYEWRFDVRRVEAQPGDLGVALHRELSAEAAPVRRATQQQIGRRCHWGLSPSASGRPRTF
jgi:hypothetical protein